MKKKEISSLKKGTHSWFSKDCINCLNRYNCISAGSFGRGLRNYFLSLKGYSYPPNEAMKAGTLKHQEAQKDLKSIDDIGIDKFLSALPSGNVLELKELPVCNPTLGFKGVIDIIRFQYLKDTNTLKIDIYELKSTFHKKDIFQISTYGMILSEKNTYVGYKKNTRKGDVRKMQSLFPKELVGSVRVCIDLHLQIIGGHEYRQMWMYDNVLSEWAKTMSMVIHQKKKAYKNFHKAGLYFLSELPECKFCLHDTRNCAYWEICKRFEYKSNKTRQRYFGKKQPLIKSKPKIQ